VREEAVDEQFDPELEPDLDDLTQVDAVGGAAPETIGNYRILHKLGEGGMGVVYEAEQLRPVRRTVALKVIKLGMDTAQVVVRFESERQALALMNHPSIARVYDAGATPEGRPYFAMECVKGVPIHEYCRRHRLPLRERLELFMRVCSGVEHAHQKGVIHRDLKPTNVLVREADGKHVAKIIDFGIAKATAQRLTDRTFYTEMGQLIGTPEYMSPEQAEMSGMDIDTRTDVYLLGLMLYELLCGELPFPAADLQQVGFQEYRRRVLEDEPPRPSARAAGRGGAATAHARTLGLEASALARALRGDLDWITMKALAKERQRRYASASELSSDVRRHLTLEPVLAGPPSNLYRMGKFARRHRAGVTFAGVLLVLLAGFAASMAVQSRKLARARDAALVAQERSEREADTLRQVTTFLEDVFKATDPAQARGRDVKASELLDHARRRIATELEGTPAVQARLMSIIGDVYSSHGLLDDARPLLEQALRLQRVTPGVDELDLAETMGAMANVLVAAGDLRQARRLLEDRVTLRARILGSEHTAVAHAKNDLANVMMLMGDNRPALELYEQSFDLLDRAVRAGVLAADDPHLAPHVTNRGALLLQAGDYAQARELLVRGLEIRERAYGRIHPHIARGLWHLGRLSEATGDFPAAKVYYERALALREELHAGDHPAIAETLHSLAILALRRRQPAEAAALHDRAQAMFERTQAQDNPIVAYNEARYRALAGDVPGALRFLDRALGRSEFRPEREIGEDPDLALLRGSPEFQALQAQMRGRAGASAPVTPAAAR